MWESIDQVPLAPGPVASRNKHKRIGRHSPETFGFDRKDSSNGDPASHQQELVRLTAVGVRGTLCQLSSQACLVLLGVKVLS